jgi:biopolymer transport protein ExbB
MNGLQDFWSQSDGIGRTVAVLLLAMSIGTWVVIVWKSWLLRRALHDIRQGTAAFWQATALDQGQQRIHGLDRERVLADLVDAACQTATVGTLQAEASSEAQITRRLRDALQSALGRLQTGQVFLASVGSVSPFVGLFGTVWGIYHALLGITSAGQMSIEKVAGPVGESLIMTATGLAVAIPAVLAYNLFGKWLGQCEAELEGFAHDLRDVVLQQHTPKF